MTAVHRSLSFFGIVLISASAARISSERPWVAEVVASIGRTGWIATFMLLAVLSATPIASLVGAKGAKVGRWRRALGLATSAFVVVHVGCVLRAGWFVEAGALLTEPNLRSGATATLVLALLGLTSWPRLVRILQIGYWKALHRSLYVAALLVCHHVALSGHAHPSWVAALALALVALLGWRLTSLARMNLTR